MLVSGGYQTSVGEMCSLQSSSDNIVQISPSSNESTSPLPYSTYDVPCASHLGISEAFSNYGDTDQQVRQCLLLHFTSVHNVCNSYLSLPLFTSS